VLTEIPSCTAVVADESTFIDVGLAIAKLHDPHQMGMRRALRRLLAELLSDCTGRRDARVKFWKGVDDSTRARAPRKPWQALDAKVAVGQLLRVLMTRFQSGRAALKVLLLARQDQSQIFARGNVSDS
jgi:hypothetical protein